MSRTMLNQGFQIASSKAVNASVAPGLPMATGAVTLEDDLNALRSQVKRLLDVQGGAEWYSDVPEAGGKKRSILQLGADLGALENKTVLARVDFQSTMTVPDGQDFLLLSVADGQTPSLPIAMGPTSAGVVVAKSALSGAAFEAAELTAQAGTTSATPKNLVVLRDATTLQAIESGGFDVFGLIQVEATATDGHAFDDTASGNRGKLSFVTINPANGQLRPADAADIGGRRINYAYVLRGPFEQMPEQSFLGTGVFTDSIADVNITMTRAVANQAGGPVPVGANLQWRVADGVNFSVQNASGAQDLLAINGSGTSAGAAINTDTLAFNTGAAVTSTKGMSVGTAAQGIDIGVDQGRISTSGSLELRAQAGGSVSLQSETGGSISLFSGSDLRLADAASLAAGGFGITLSSSQADWTAFQAAFGSASLIGGIVAAASNASHTIKWANVTGTIAAGTNVVGYGETPNLDAQLPNYNVENWQTEVKVYVNGQLLRAGADASDTTCDWYKGTSPSQGDIKFTFNLQAGDVVAIETFSAPSA